MMLLSSPLATPIFHIEKKEKPKSRRPSFSGLDTEYLLRDSVSKLLAVKNRIFTATGSFPYDPSQLVLFFRTKSGISHVLDFPIDVEVSAPPALDVLIAACRPHQISDLDGYAEQESLFYPPTLPLTTSLGLTDHPVMDAIRSALFPSLPAGSYLTATREKLEVLVAGSRLAIQPRSLRNDGHVATLIVTLPVSFSGGSLVVYDSDGQKETFPDRGLDNKHLSWTAFLADCDYEVEPVHKGCRISISYSVSLKTSGISLDHLINPSNRFFDHLGPLLALCRGRKIAFYLSASYTADPSEVSAMSLIPQLNGGDLILYNALRLYKLTPDIHWSAGGSGGYIWPVDRAVQLPTDADTRFDGLTPMPSPPYSPLRGKFSIYSDTGVEDEHRLNSKIRASGAVSMAEADISVLHDWTSFSVVGKERVPFISGGDLDKLVINALIVVYVPSALLL